MIKTAFFIVAIPVSLQAHAIDCDRASKDYEQLICKYEYLGTTDDNLNSIYKAAIKHSADPKEVKQEQRRWVTNIQSKCTTISCMQSVYAARIEQLVESYSPWCIANNSKIQGPWGNDGAGGSFEELSINPDGTFNSWLHQRPDTFGTWKVKGCHITISSGSNMVFNWILFDIDDSRIHMVDLGENGVAVFTKIKE